MLLEIELSEYKWEKVDCFYIKKILTITFIAPHKGKTQLVNENIYSACVVPNMEFVLKLKPF